MSLANSQNDVAQSRQLIADILDKSQDGLSFATRLLELINYVPDAVTEGALIIGTNCLQIQSGIDALEQDIDSVVAFVPAENILAFESLLSREIPYDSGFRADFMTDILRYAVVAEAILRDRENINLRMESSYQIVSSIEDLEDAKLAAVDVLSGLIGRVAHGFALNKNTTSAIIKCYHDSAQMLQDMGLSDGPLQTQDLFVLLVKREVLAPQLWQHLKTALQSQVPTSVHDSQAYLDPILGSDVENANLIMQHLINSSALSEAITEIYGEFEAAPPRPETLGDRIINILTNILVYALSIFGLGCCAGDDRDTSEVAEYSGSSPAGYMTNINSATTEACMGKY